MAKLLLRGRAKTQCRAETLHCRSNVIRERRTELYQERHAGKGKAEKFIGGGKRLCRLSNLLLSRRGNRVEWHMIKLTFCLHRLSSLSREAFQTYWFEKHAPLVARHRDALRIRRYVQMHAATTEMNDAIRTGRNAPDMYDGVAQLWWNSMDDLIAATSSAEGQAAGLALLEDERKFIDLARSPLFFGEEKTIFGS